MKPTQYNRMRDTMLLYNNQHISFRKTNPTPSQVRSSDIRMIVSEKGWQEIRHSLIGTWKKTPIENIKILEEWLLYCKNENILTDIDNKHGDNFDCFRDHRHDQSILTNIKVKYNLTSNDVLRNYVVCNV